MKKVLKCSAAGFNCPHVIEGMSEEEILEHAAKHFAEAHDLGVSEAEAAAFKAKHAIMEA